LEHFSRSTVQPFGHRCCPQSGTGSFKKDIAGSAAAVFSEATLVKTVPELGRQVPCEKCPLHSKAVFRKFSPEELAFVSDFKSGEMNAEDGTTLYLEGTNSAHLYTLLSGWAFRYKTLPDGRRQILNFVLPGDFLGLQATIINEMQHSVETLTAALLCVFPRDKLWNLYTQFPSLAFDLTWLAAREEQMLDEHLLSVGRRHALERVAFVLLHLYRRCEDIGLASGNKIQFPFTQQHLADSLGMSLVHTNKTIRRLCDRKVVRWKDKMFEIIDRDELAKIAMFDVNDKRPRPFI
jgi:CRP/FNR family transcriptional regulator, anaerobic regulatory protein